MVIFAAIALGAFLVVAGSFLLGHDHDLGGDFDHDLSGGLDHDVSGGLDQEAGVDTHGMVSIFSTKVVFTFIMGFGAAGAIAQYYDTGYPIASLLGVAAGVVLATIMYGIILLFTEQQSNSVIGAAALLGCTGTVTVPIDQGRIGEIGVSVGGEYRTYAARAQSPAPLQKGHAVRIVGVTGSIVTVDEHKAG